MTLTQLEYVLAVYEHQHFGKAAASCHVTQPTLSMQIQKLEDELELTIFDRSLSPIQVTEEGRLIVDQAKIIISEGKKLYSLVDESKETLSGDFRLSVIPTLSPFIIPLFVKDFTEKFPNLNLIIKESVTETIVQEIEEGIIDAALLVTPLYNKNIVEKSLYYEPFYLFTSRENDLYKKNKIKQEELNIHEILLLNKGHCFRDQVLNICSHVKEGEITENLKFESGNFETLKNLVNKGYGYTILPQMALENIHPDQQDMVKEFAAPTPTREVSLIYSKNCVKQKALSALEEEILAVVPDDIRQIYNQKQAIIDIT